MSYSIQCDNCDRAESLAEDDDSVQLHPSQWLEINISYARGRKDGLISSWDGDKIHLCPHCRPAEKEEGVFDEFLRREGVSAALLAIANYRINHEREVSQATEQATT